MNGKYQPDPILWWPEGSAELEARIEERGRARARRDQEVRRSNAAGRQPGERNKVKHNRAASKRAARREMASW